ncbi:MAG: alpha/beta fold hydrolase, partial [Planctomycetes bacterium]|nr:alpha/beta fold hydrolase [Planctomycetota bacterium]
VLGRDRSGADRLFEMTWPCFRREGAGLTISILDRAASSILTDPVPDDEIRAIRAPVLLVWGTHDRVVPVAEGDRIHALLPQARYERWEGVGHLPMFERPDAFRDLLLPFLEEQDRRS